MSSGLQPHGFTIIEVLIVLGLASFMFVAAALAMNGDQKQTEFDTGARQIFTELQSLSTDVSNGLYPNSKITCNYDFYDPIPESYPSFSSGSNQPGTNLGCVYLGKAIQFNPSALSSTYYYVYSLVGVQYTDSTLSLPPAFPAYATVLDTTRAQPASLPPGGTQVVGLPDNFYVKKITFSNNPNGVSNDIVGFYNSGTSDLSTASSLSDQLFIMPTTNPGGSGAITELNNDNTPSNGLDQVGYYDTDPSAPLTVCFSSPLEPNEVVNIIFENQANTTNLVLNYSYNGC